MLKAPVPYTRRPISPGQPHRDRKNDYVRQPKHRKKKPNEGESIDQ